MKTFNVNEQAKKVRNLVFYTQLTIAVTKKEKGQKHYTFADSETEKRKSLDFQSSNDSLLSFYGCHDLSSQNQKLYYHKMSLSWAFCLSHSLPFWAVESLKKEEGRAEREKKSETEKMKETLQGTITVI